MGHIKTLGVAAAAVLAAMGVMGPSASASKGPSGTKVDLATEGFIAATAGSLVLTVGEKQISCHVTLMTELRTDGSVHIWDVGSEVTAGEPACSLVELEGFWQADENTGATTWGGKICGNEIGGATLYLDTQFSTPLGQFGGWIEAPLVGSEALGFDGATVATNVGGGSATLFGTFWFGSTVEGAETPGTSC